MPPEPVAVEPALTGDFATPFEHGYAQPIAPGKLGIAVDVDYVEVAEVPAELERQLDQELVAEMTAVADIKD